MSAAGWDDATSQAELVRTGRASAVELLETAIGTVERLNPTLNAVIDRWYDDARRTARDVPAHGPFAGVPFLLKDLSTPYAGRPLSKGNRALRDAAVASERDSVLVRRFRDAGLVALGRTNSSEFGGLPTTEPVAFGPSRNPWDPARSPGGSSGGAAAAVAAGMVPVAHASDGGGSLRIPASLCGLVGLKPSQGRISAGPDGDESGLGVDLCLTRTVRDCAAMLDAVAGPDVGDAVVAPPPGGRYVSELTTDPGRLRIGVLDHQPQGLPVHDECVTAVRRSAQLLEQLGHVVEPGHPDALEDRGIGPASGILRDVHLAAEVEAMTETLGRTTTEDDVEPQTWLAVERARILSATALAGALQARLRFRRAMHSWWVDGPDLLLTPTTGSPAWLVGELTETSRIRATVAFTQPFNLSGQPAISLPLHQTPDGLPVGVQLVAAYGREDLLLRVAAQLEAARPWAHLVPPL